MAHATPSKFTIFNLTLVVNLAARTARVVQKRVRVFFCCCCSSGGDESLRLICPYTFGRWWVGGCILCTLVYCVKLHWRWIGIHHHSSSHFGERICPRCQRLGVDTFARTIEVFFSIWVRASIQPRIGNPKSSGVQVRLASWPHVPSGMCVCVCVI